MKAMILAAGRGERMRPLTDHTPKPLLSAGGKPLIEHLIERLVLAGIRDIIVNTAHLGEQIEAYFGYGDRYGASIQYSPEEVALETGGGIYRALPLLGAGPFMVINGDIGTDFPFETLKNKTTHLAHLILVPNPPHHPYGDFALNGRLLESEGDIRYTFGGIGVYRPELFSECEPGRFALAPLLRKGMDKQSVTGEVYSGFWMDIGTRERLSEFDAYLKGR